MFIKKKGGECMDIEVIGEAKKAKDFGEACCAVDVWTVVVDD